MKKIYLIALSLVSFSSAQAESVLLLKGTGSWESNGIKPERTTIEFPAVMDGEKIMTKLDVMKAATVPPSNVFARAFNELEFVSDKEVRDYLRQMYCGRQKPFEVKVRQVIRLYDQSKKGFLGVSITVPKFYMSDDPKVIKTLFLNIYYATKAKATGKIKTDTFICSS